MNHEHGSNEYIKDAVGQDPSRKAQKSTIANERCDIDNTGNHKGGTNDKRDGCKGKAWEECAYQAEDDKQYAGNDELPVPFGFRVHD